MIASRAQAVGLIPPSAANRFIAAAVAASIVVEMDTMSLP